MNHPDHSKVKDWQAHIRAFRQRHGLTQQQLAEKLPAAISSVEDWERGKYKPSAYLKRALRDLARELTTSGLVKAHAPEPNE